MATPVQPILISDAQAREMFGVEMNVHFQQVILLSGDTTIQGNLSQGWTEETLEFLGVTGASGNTLILVDGNLTVTGAVGPADESFTHLLVLGNVQCEVLKSYDEFIFITGDADIKYALDGFYNHGDLKILGTTRVPYVLNSDHSMRITPEGATLINYYDNNERYLPYDFKEKDLERVMVPEVMDEQYGFGANAFINLLKAGKSPLKEGVRTARQLQEDEMAQLGKGNTVVTELDLSAKKLQSFPDNISTIPTLKKLILNSNIIRVVPVAIKDLVNLEELHLEGCGLKNLPEEIGQLQQLRVLNVANNPGLQLPESINQLSSLKTLIVYNNIVLEFPANLAGLNKLEELNCYHNSAAAPIDFPVWLTQFPALKRLNIGDNSFKAIPESILELEQLEELSLDTALCYINELPDLSKLKKLKVLRAGGMRTYITRPAAKQSLLQSFFTITSMEELYIHQHGLWMEEAMSREIYEEMQRHLADDPARLKDLDVRLSNVPNSDDKRGVLRNNLTTAPLEGISNLQQLIMLDLSRNGLDSLPDEIFTLKNLQFLNLQHNRLTISERSRIASKLPGCAIDFRNNEPENETSDPEIIMEWQSMNKQLKFANMLRIVMGDREKLLMALVTYNEVIEYFTSGNLVEKEPLLQANLGKVYVYSYLAFTHKETFSPAEWQDLVQAGIEQGLHTLNILPEKIWLNTELGKFHQEGTRVAANSVAWMMQAVGTNKQDFERALDIVGKALPHIETARDYYIYNTQVRILLQLGRQAEAWQVVSNVLQKSPDFESFQEFKTDTAYLYWVK